MRVLVTGGAGFIGSHVSAALIERGHEVVALDNLSSGKRANVPTGATLEEVDVRDFDAVRAVVKAFRPQAVTHQAAQVSVSVSVREPIVDAQVNVLGGLNVLEACRLEDAGQRFVFASTGGALYGEVPDGQRASEETPIRPMSPYAASKAAFERYLEIYDHEHGFASRVLRYANVYGPRQDPHGEAGVVAIFCQRLLKNEPVGVHARAEEGDGGCIRDYTFVADVVAANCLAIEGELPQRIVNVASGHPTSTADLLGALRELTGSSSEVGQWARRPGDVERSVLQPSACLKEPVALRDGLATTLEWFRNAGA